MLVGSVDGCELEYAGLPARRACQEDGEAAGLGEKRTQHVPNDAIRRRNSVHFFHQCSAPSDEVVVFEKPEPPRRRMTSPVHPSFEVHPVPFDPSLHLGVL